MIFFNTEANNIIKFKGSGGRGRKELPQVFDKLQLSRWLVLLVATKLIAAVHLKNEFIEDDMI